MDWYEDEVRQLEKMRAKEEHPPVFYGSSSFRLWDTLADDFDERVLNLGFGGSTLEACDYFFARLVPPRKPQSLLVYAGDNDLGDGRTVEAVFESFRSMAKKVEDSLGEISFGFVSVKPSPARCSLLPCIRRLNDLVRDEIEKRPTSYYVDVFTPMLDEKGRPRTQLYLEDGLHINREGYKLWARVLEPFRNQIFTQ